ncbi:hypothetical protein ACIB24_00970 [Spongisporangium articulatum]|uniref:Ribbon-helix-helix protein CopG domain-containing protein n=1 Tax=Spongisporangium articulatum TaxID=3362603 RepID=A0ABW8AGZ8_9ACTN
MADTTIKVDKAVRDRLAILAAERGTTIRDLVAELAGVTPTEAENQARYEKAVAYVRAHLYPGFNEEDARAGDEMWAMLDQMAEDRARRLAIERQPGP